MEKRRPTYDLNAIKRTMGTEETLSITRSAIRDAQNIGFNAQDIADTIIGIVPSMFYKSMTTYADHQLWQDVYHVPSGRLVLYVKFQADLVTEFRVMSFKEL